LKIKLKVKYVKQKNFTFILRPSAPYPCTLPHIPVPCPISLYLFPISLYLTKRIFHKKAFISVAYRRFTSFPHIPVPFPYFWTSHPIFLDFSPGFDHGVGHPLLLLYDAKAPNCRKNKAFKGLGHYSEWPKVANAMIKASHPIFLDFSPHISGLLTPYFWTYRKLTY
jgi:hypothetical protein